MKALSDINIRPVTNVSFEGIVFEDNKVTGTMLVQPAWEFAFTIRESFPIAKRVTTLLDAAKRFATRYDLARLGLGV